MFSETDVNYPAVNGEVSNARRGRMNKNGGVSMFGMTLSTTDPGELRLLSVVHGEEFLYSLPEDSNMLVLFRYLRGVEIPGPREIFKADTTFHEYSWSEKPLSPYVALPLLAVGVRSSLFFQALYHMESTRPGNPSLTEGTGLTIREASVIKDCFLNMFSTAQQRENQNKLYLSGTHGTILVLHAETTAAGGKKCYLPKHGNIRNLARFALATGRFWSNMEALREEKAAKRASVRNSQERVF